MKYALIFISLLSFNTIASTENDFNCDQYKKSIFQTGQQTNLQNVIIQARHIVIKKNHQSLNSNKFYDFLEKSTNNNKSLNQSLFTCLVVEDMGYDYEKRVFDIKQKFELQKRMARLKKLESRPLNNHSIVMVSSLATKINPFVLQKMVEESTENRILDTVKFNALIEEYKTKNKI